MLNALKAGLVATLLLSAATAHAGGPVIIEEGNDELIVETPGNQIGILPIIGALILIGLVASGGGGGGGGGGTEPDDEKCPGGCE